MSRSTSADIPVTIGSWIAFDLEWEPAPIIRVKNTVLHPYVQQITSDTSEPPKSEKYHRITTFAYEDSNGNKRTIDIADFSDYQNPQEEFLLAIRNKLLLYDYCFGWGSKAIKHKNETTGRLEGIYGDLFVLDNNFRFNGIESIIRYDRFTGLPYIKFRSSSPTTDIDLLRVFAKALVKYVIFKNRYKSLHLDEVSRVLLGYSKVASGEDIMNMSVAERKAYCLQDAHIVADLVRINNGDIMKIMQVISKHTGLKLNEVCHKGMTAIWV